MRVLFTFTTPLEFTELYQTVKSIDRKTTILDFHVGIIRALGSRCLDVDQRYYTLSYSRDIDEHLLRQYGFLEQIQELEDTVPLSDSVLIDVHFNPIIWRAIIELPQSKRIHYIRD